jgi:hypothetical protein
MLSNKAKKISFCNDLQKSLLLVNSTAFLKPSPILSFIFKLQKHKTPLSDNSKKFKILPLFICTQNTQHKTTLFHKKTTIKTTQNESVRKL